MNTPELAARLEVCLHLARRDIAAADKETFKKARGALSAELNTLLQEAVDMKWPFVEEKWQYKHSVASEDKVNTTELVGRHLPQLTAFLRASITAAEPAWAMSVIFLLDRFLYWIDGSHTLLKIAKALHAHYPETPVAPQIIIRQARVYLNTGKLQKAEYILSSLINNNGATGCWEYQRDCDRVLVQSVSVQVRGQVLQKLGLWLEAAELFWASLVGFHVLPLPDKKGIGTSLGLLANVLISMTDEDFSAFQKKNPHINLGFLGDCNHRLLCAAQAAKMAAVYSQYGSLYVLTHMVTRGTCLLSYSFSKDCPAPAKCTYLALAKEAFENGLLTKEEHEVVTSQQELHTLLKAAYCLATTNKWMFGPSEQVNAALQACQEAVVLFYSYCFKDAPDKNTLSSGVMAKLQHVKALLKTKPFQNSDPRSFIPDSYHAVEGGPVPFTVDSFAKVMEGFQKHHKSVCEAFSVPKCAGGHQDTSHSNCITAVQTRTESLATECRTTSHKSSQCQEGIENEDILAKPEISDQCSETVPDTMESEEKKPGQEGQKAQISRISAGSSSLGTSWTSLSDNSGTSPVLVDPFCCTEVDDNEGENKQNTRNGVESKGAKPANASSETRRDLSFQGSESHPKRSIQELCTTLASEDNNYGGTGASHQACTDLSFLANASQQQSAQELCSTLGSEEYHQITNSFAGKDKNTRTSSGSFSSLGSSWQSISFSKSPHTGDLTDVLESKRAVDQNCDTLPSEDGPVSSFEYLNLNSSASSIQKEHLSPSYQTENDAGKAQTGSFNNRQSLPSTDLDSFEFLEFDQSGPKQAITSAVNVTAFPPVETKDDAQERSRMFGKRTDNTDCDLGSSNSLFSKMNCPKGCFQGCNMGSVVLTEQDYRSLLSGVCQSCLLRRLPDKPFKLGHYSKAYSALVLKYSKTADSWTACETNVYVGEVLKMDVEGRQRQAFRVQYLHQELLLGSYVGKEYLKERKIDSHLGDVERQMTAQFYVMEFNKRLYENNITTQIFYLPSELLLLLDADTILACVSVEPYMLGEFVKLTNNTTKINNHHSTTEYGIAFGHFTYEFSNGQEVVVDLQGWMTANGKGLMYLTDPQIHTLRKAKSVNNFHYNGIRKFLQDQHGEHCNSICTRAALRVLPPQSENSKKKEKKHDY